jgi:hypothetical protein
MRFDIFPKAIESSLRVRTNTGGLLTVVSVMALFFWIAVEYQAWSEVRPKTKMMLKTKPPPSQIPINIKIDLLNNCSNFRVQLLNYKGTAEIEGKVQRNERQSHDVCRMNFQIEAPHIPASFRVSLSDPKMPNGPPIWALMKDRNLSHRITVLTFGEPPRPTSIDGYEEVIFKDVPYILTYTLSLVPEYDDQGRYGFHVLPVYSKANVEKMQLKEYPGVLLRWNFSPVLLYKDAEREPVIQIICRVLALAGVFFVFVRMIDTVMFRLSCADE